MRVPYIIRAPHKPASHGVKTTALAEAVDLYQVSELPANKAAQIDAISG